METKIEELIQKISSKFEQQGFEFEPFIRYIRFPKYKNFAKDARIDFLFPITVLVGENGCNKSSVIRALYGAPAQKSLGDYWFESKIDTIKEEEQIKSCFIYGYNNPLAGEVVEVLKTRVKKENNPDYWEPSRPIVNYGMKRLEEKKNLTKKEKRFRSQTRWNTINKNVVYLDFRHEALSAYDKFFYCTSLNSVSGAFKSKQDYIRRYSRNIKKAIDENLKVYNIYNKKKIHENRTLDRRAVKCISQILNREYSSVRIITHSFYTSEPAKTVFLTSGTGTDYSEAFAGSGEFSVVCLVDAILNAAPKSLILLDEPEVSIHPYAQQKLMEFLLQQVLEKKHQIVIATHSPYITKNLPKGAVKMLFLGEENKVKVRNNVYPAEVFVEIGTLKSKLTILVEDECAKIVLEACLRNIGKEKLFKVCSAERFGAEGILNHDAVTDFTEGAEDVVYCLDGDQRKDFPEISNNLEELEASVSIFAAKINLTQSNASESIKINKYQGFLQYLRRKLYYLPDTFGPEEIVWAVVPEEVKNGVNVVPSSKIEYKEAIRQATKNHFGNDNGIAIKKYIEYNAAFLLKKNYETKFDNELRSLLDNLSIACNEIYN